MEEAKEGEALCWDFHSRLGSGWALWRSRPFFPAWSFKEGGALRPALPASQLHFVVISWKGVLMQERVFNLLELTYLFPRAAALSGQDPSLHSPIEELKFRRFQQFRECLSISYAGAGVS